MTQLGTHKSGDAVSLFFPLNVLDVVSASYTIKDGRAAVIAEDVLIQLEPGQMSVSFVVPAEYNQLGEKDRDLRRVIVKYNDGSLSHETDQMYVLMSDYELSVPEQSFATLADTQMMAIDLLSGDNLLADGESMMRKRLIEATNRIKDLPFSFRRILGLDYDGYERPQNMLNVKTIPLGMAGKYRVDLVDWETVTPDEFYSFPEFFRKALMRAVINEACEIANGNDVASAREDGILSESIGETTNMYRTGKPANKKVASTTWRILTKYTNNRAIVRRA